MANKYGVKVGDLFRAVWGYEQTNNDFFQVLELVGETFVRVRQVEPEMLASKRYSSGMAEDRIYKIPTEILPPTCHSLFIKDQERGDLKKIKSYQRDGSKPLFKMSSYADAYKVEGDTLECYESWYY